MTLQQSTSLWFWLLGGIILLREFWHPYHLADMLLAVGVLVILRIATYFIARQDALAGRWIIHPVLGLLCLWLLGSFLLALRA